MLAPWASSENQVESVSQVALTLAVPRTFPVAFRGDGIEECHFRGVWALPLFEPEMPQLAI